MDSLDLATWNWLVTTVREDEVKQLGWRPGGSDLNCLMESETVGRVFVDISLKKFGWEGQQKKWKIMEGVCAGKEDFVLF